LLAVALTGGPVRAQVQVQVPPPERADEVHTGRVITAIDVEGSPDQASGDSAREVFGLRAGDVLDAAAVRLGIRRVFLTGTWADVRVYAELDGPGVRVVLRLTPDMLIGEVLLQASGGVPIDRLRPAIGLNPGDRFRSESVERARAQLEAAAAELGWPLAEAAAEIEPLPSGEHRLRFFVELGEPTRVKTVRIVGSPRLGEAEVLASVGVVAGEPFDRIRLEQGLARVRDRLLERRYLNARAELIDAGYSDDRQQVNLVLRVDAGARYRIDYVGNAAIADAYLRTHLNEERLGSLERASLSRALRRVEEFYQDAGYARVRVRSDEVPAYPPWDDDADRVLRIHVDEGPRVMVREVIVEGGVAKDGRGMAADIWSFALSEMPVGGLIQRVDTGDVLDLLDGAADGERPEDYVGFDVSFFGLPIFSGDARPVYVERVFEQAAQRLSDLYRKDGFLAVGVYGPEPIWLEGGKEVRVRYRIEEGTQTRVAGVRFEPPPTLPLAELLEEVTLLPGDAADRFVIEETRLTLERNLRERGFPFARVEERLERLQEEGLAEVVYEIDEGPRVRIGKVRVRGNRTTREFVVIDRVLMREGEWYAAGRVEESRQRLLRTGLFTSVSIDFLDDEEDAVQRDLLVEVREKKLNAVEGGVGGSIEDGPRLFVAYERRNILGFGVGVRARAQVNYPALLYPFLYTGEATSPAESFFTDVDPLYRWALFFEGQGLVTMEIPKVYGLPFDARYHVDGVFQREVRPAFTLLKGSVVTGVDAQPIQWLHLNPQLEGEVSDFDCPSLELGKGCGASSSVRLRRTDQGTLYQVTARLLTSVDLRDDPFRPHAGFYTSLGTDLALGAGELRGQDEGPVESNFVRLTGTVSGYVPLAPEATLALTARGGNIFPLATSTTGTLNYVPLFKRFYLGGTSTIRGFNFDEILPSDEKGWEATQLDPCLVVEDPDWSPDPNNPDAAPDVVCDPDFVPTSLGGEFFLNARAELRLAVLGELELGTFIDVGQLAHDVTKVQLAGFAIGAGVGMRYNTPVGPFVIDFGWKVIDGQRRLPAVFSADRLFPNLHLSIGYF
jgi:outer membrane protein assembly factor BamA